MSEQVGIPKLVRIYAYLYALGSVLGVVLLAMTFFFRTLTPAEPPTVLAPPRQGASAESQQGQAQGPEAILRAQEEAIRAQEEAVRGAQNLTRAIRKTMPIAYAALTALSLAYGLTAFALLRGRRWGVYLLIGLSLISTGWALLVGIAAARESAAASVGAMIGLALLLVYFGPPLVSCRRHWASFR